MISFVAAAGKQGNYSQGKADLCMKTRPLLMLLVIGLRAPHSTEETRIFVQISEICYIPHSFVTKEPPSQVSYIDVCISLPLSIILARISTSDKTFEPFSSQHWQKLH